MDCFVTRLATHPERLSNVYFNAVLLLRAVARAAPYLQAYDIGVAPSGRLVDDSACAKREEDEQAKLSLDSVISLAKGEEMAQGFDEGALFTGPDAVVGL